MVNIYFISCEDFLKHKSTGLGGSPGRGNDNPLQYSCLENSRDRGAWWATVHGVAKSWTQLSSHARTGLLNPRSYYYSLECPN